MIRERKTTIKEERRERDIADEGKGEGGEGEGG